MKKHLFRMVLTATLSISLAPFLRAADGPTAPATENLNPPASIELWINAFPNGGSNERDNPRGAWTLFVDDLRIKQSASDAQEGVSILSPEQDHEVLNNGYLVQKVEQVAATPELPAAEGEKYAAIVIDPSVTRHIPRGLKCLPLPDLALGKHFVVTAKVRAKEKDGIVASSLACNFLDKDRVVVKGFSSKQVEVNADGWVELKLEFDYDK